MSGTAGAPAGKVKLDLPSSNTAGFGTKSFRQSFVAPVKMADSSEAIATTLVAAVATTAAATTAMVIAVDRFHRHRWRRAGYGDLVADEGRSQARPPELHAEDALWPPSPKESPAPPLGQVRHPEYISTYL